jgi:uncharacterized membrane protein YdbT with pleckstrin-like domain
MSLFDKNLLPDEKIVYRTKKHYIIFFAPVIWSIATLCFLAYDDPLVKKLAFVPGLMALVTGINQYLIYTFSEFAITNKRIMMREGFFFRHTNETRIATIANVSVTQSLLGQFLDYGSLVVYIFGGDNDPFTDIASPNELQKQIQMQLDKVAR